MPGTPFEEGGSSCTLPDGRVGVGRGEYGCVDPTGCHCKAEASEATCDSGTCVYAACNGANQGAACALADGARGTCCAGVCRQLDVDHDPLNCGGCGNVCPDGVACAYGTCAAGGACAAGLVLANTTCVRSSCTACVPADCAGRADGTPCAIAYSTAPAGELAGICCGQACAAWWSDGQNCGGCGITCCGGTTCSPTGDFASSVCG